MSRCLLPSIAHEITFKPHTLHTLHPSNQASSHRPTRLITLSVPRGLPITNTTPGRKPPPHGLHIQPVPLFVKQHHPPLMHLHLPTPLPQIRQNAGLCREVVEGVYRRHWGAGSPFTDPGAAGCLLISLKAGSEFLGFIGLVVEKSVEGD